MWSSYARNRMVGAVARQPTGTTIDHPKQAMRACRLKCGRAMPAAEWWSQDKQLGLRLIIGNRVRARAVLNVVELCPQRNGD